MEYHNTYVLYVSICTIMLCYVIISCYQLIGTHIYIYVIICYYMLLYIILCYYIYMLLYIIIYSCIYLWGCTMVSIHGDTTGFLMGYIIILYQKRLLPALKSPIVCIDSLFFVDILHYLMFFVVHSEAFSIRNTDRLVVGAPKAIVSPNTFITLH